MKIGIVFAGQGAQYPGMGKDLYDSFPEAREVFEKAGKEVSGWCFEGTKEMLRKTQITQPAIYTVTMAAYEAFVARLREEGILEKMEISGISGFSLGEYAALTVGGSIGSIEEGLGIVKQRGNLMNDAGKDQEGNQRGGMVAGFGRRESILKSVKEAAEGRILQGVNFNSPVQTVVAGEREALEDFVEVAKKNRVKAKMLSVSTAFHSEMMNPAVEPLRNILLDAKLKTPNITTYSNVTAKDIMDGYEDGDVGHYLADVMANQTKSPVYWQEIVENMVDSGVELIIEIGPGNTLSGLTKKISKTVETLNVEDRESLENAVNRLKEMIEC